MRLRTPRLVIGGVVITLVAAGVAVLWTAGRSSVASASSSRPGFAAAKVLPGADGEWRSSAETVGAWVELQWGSAADVTRVVLKPGDPRRPGVAEGYLSFGDGSRVHVRMSNDDVVVPVTSRRVDSVRFTVTAVQAGATEVSLSEFSVDDGVGAAVAADSPGDGDVAGLASLSGAGGNLGALVDGDAGTTTVVGRYVELTWAQPREITMVAIAGSSTGPTLRSATLTFSDGSSLPFGGVTADSTRPTSVAFMPRVTTSLRVSVDLTEGDGELSLADLVVKQVGSSPVSAASDGADPTSPGAVSAAGCVPPEPSGDDGVVVLCPTTGATVDDLVRVVVATGPSYTSVSAALWAGDSDVPSEDPLEVDVGPDGTTTLELDVGYLPSGPFTVRIEARDGSFGGAGTFLHLDKTSGQRVEQADVSPPGRTMVFEDEFQSPLSVSKTGEDADYAAGKPEATYVADFGDAPFADPAEGLGNLQVVNDDYLKLSALPRPSDGQLVGSMLASARPGGSGFSAQYGYFEARMLLPAAPGTWPAFWMLPMPNLVEPEDVVAEIDAVEHYGHDPTGACHTTHQYPDPEQVGEADCDQRWSDDRQALAWHVFAVDVSPTTVSFFIDGVEVASAPQVGGGDEPMFFLIDLALGGGWPVDLSATRGRAELYVDWIRVYV